MRHANLAVQSFAAGLCLLALSVSAHAVAAYGPGQQLSTQTVSQFTANPSQILSQNPNGGAAMISQLRDLLASDPATLATIMSLLPNANAGQKSAIATALAQAAKLYARVDRDFAGQIQQAVANTKDQELIVAYAAAAGDEPIAATGGTSSGGGVGGQTSALGGGGVSTGAAQGIGAGGSDSGQFAGLTGGSATGSGGSNGSSTTNTTNTSSTSVSP